MSGLGVLAAVVLADPVSVSPSGGALPGGDLINRLLGGLSQWGLWGSVFAMLGGGLIWGVSHRANSMSGAHRGRDLVIGGLIGALVIGAAPALVNFAFSSGQGVH